MSNDYTTGELRKHHELYFEDGNFVMQVENAIFKVHRSLLMRYSSVIQDMLNVPNENGSQDGTDEKPLIFPGDSVLGWEAILEFQYAIPRFNGQPFHKDRMLLVLLIAHKYCMGNIETDITNGMKKDTSSDGYVNLIVASRIVGSDELYQIGLNGLKSSGEAPSVAQAELIGAKATHVVMMEVITAHDAGHMTALSTIKAELAAASAKSDSRKCRHCHRRTNWVCSHDSCGSLQVPY